MSKCAVKVCKEVKPMIYAYTTPGIIYHEGCIKIGYTEKDVDERIREQVHTAGIKTKKEWIGTAIFEDGSFDLFKDIDFHDYLRKNGILQPQEIDDENFEKDDKNEWFVISPIDSKNLFYDFKANRGIIETLDEYVVPYVLRDEQKKAINMTAEYYNKHKDEKAEFLWNCKPRFGKTITAYDFCKRINATNVLIITNRPAIANSWYDDYVKFLGTQSGYYFVSQVDALKGKKYVLSRKDYIDKAKFAKEEDNIKCIEFVSLQDIKTSKYFNNKATTDKLKELKDMNWDLLVIDEAHEAIDTYKTDVALDQVNIHRKFTLHLSGTPFKAIANDKFPDDAIFTWTYADEQNAKENWNISTINNPYFDLPKLNLYSYKMSDIIKDDLSEGIDIDGEKKAYAFDLNEFFSTDGNNKFIYSDEVDKFLDSLSTKEKFPFSTPELRNEIKHSLWLLDRVDSVKALYNKLKNHPIFSDYEIVVAAGDGRIDDNDEIEKSYDKVKKAIEKSGKKTITLSVGQLTTGVTIPEWTAVFMLCNVKSPALYMQAAFRAQNPCLFQNGIECYRKENAYVFDFDPARTLIIYEHFANDLSIDYAKGKGTNENRKENISKLLNFFPVLAEDEKGEMILLDAEKVLTIPRKIKSTEVVNHGFMSDFLFQNIGRVFNAPKAVYEIIEKFNTSKENKNFSVDSNTKNELMLDENGDVQIMDEIVVGKAKDIFGDKIYEASNDAVNMIKNADDVEDLYDNRNKIINNVIDNVKNNIIKQVEENYIEDNIKSSDKKIIEKNAENKTEELIEKKLIQMQIDINVLEKEKEEELKRRFETKKSTEEIEKEFEEKKENINKKSKDDLLNSINELFEEQKTESIKIIEKNVKEREKKVKEDEIKDHLRGFSRTIPSFIMAYSNDNVITLKNFDKIIPDNVFKEVTSIELKDFIFLRDGGDYFDEETNTTKHFDGNIFDEIVFDDSVKEFIDLKKKLKNYFDEKNKKDIFDYIPPQKTNQIFTPKNVVIKMVNMLEKEEPGCFDNPDKTFADLYMKSGLYIAEIVKRLYRSEKMKQVIANDDERLAHIFAKQVYGLAPTEIIYRIATNFILGFNDNAKDFCCNFKQIDSVPLVKDGLTEEKLDEIFEIKG